jgi:DNA-binding PadR family transcriptional regulator
MTAIAATSWAGPGEHRRGRAGKALLGAAVLHAMAGHKRHRGGPGGHGFDPRGFAFGMRGFGPFGFGPQGRGGRRARRGDVRAATLLLLEEEPRNGYQLMQEIEERSGGAWRPSPGSIYPALSQLEDEGLVRSNESAGRRAFELTDEGRAYVAEHRDALGSPWDEAGGDIPEDLAELRNLMAQLGMATMQVAQAGNESQTAEARKVLEDARRAIYGILADG